MAVRYKADNNLIPFGRYDDGKYHTTCENLRLDARYQLAVEKVALALALGGQLPLTDYEANGSAGIARGLPVASVGFHLDQVPGVRKSQGEQGS